MSWVNIEKSFELSYDIGNQLLQFLLLLDVSSKRHGVLPVQFNIRLLSVNLLGVPDTISPRALSNEFRV